ncbi:MAG TPA: ABC transporter permease [Acidimicrobiales bacterium]|nr:ABC transporter permease [Acidimicrobiales bacterium]
MKPELVIEGGRGRFSFHELWVFREVLWAFTVRQVKVKYKQAAVGIGWAVLQPVIAAAVFAVFLGRIGGIRSEGVPYLLFALVGMVAWTYFTTAADGAINSLVADQGLLRKVYFPREILPIAAVGAAVLDFIFGMLALCLVAAIFYGIEPQFHLLALPVCFVILTLSAVAIGLGLSAVNVYYRDVRYALPFVLQLLLFCSPVVYPLSEVPDRWERLYAVVNPLAAAIDGTRRIILHDSWPDATVTAAALCWAAVLTAAGMMLFKRLERGFADRV